MTSEETGKNSSFKGPGQPVTASMQIIRGMNLAGLVEVIPNLYRLVSTISEGKSILSACKVPQFDGDLGPNISHKNVSYDKKSYTTTNGMD